MIMWIGEWCDLCEVMYLNRYDLWCLYTLDDIVNMRMMWLIIDDYIICVMIGLKIYSYDVSILGMMSMYICYTWILECYSCAYIFVCEYYLTPQWSFGWPPHHL